MPAMLFNEFTSSRQLTGYFKKEYFSLPRF
jgi:hypothetical protein